MQFQIRCREGLRTGAGIVAVVASVLASTCSNPTPPGATPGTAQGGAASSAAQGAGAPNAAATAAPGNEEPKPQAEVVLPEELRSLIDRPFSGDLEGMVSRRLIRVGVPFNRTFFFIDKGTPRGLSYEYISRFEEDLNTRRKTGNLKVHVVMLPLPHDALFPALESGKIDLAVAQLTVTPARQKVVDFTRPTRANVSEVLVTAPRTPPVASLTDLAGREVFVRRSSSYYESLTGLSRMLQSQGKPAIVIQAASENLEDDDLLEMVNAGLIPATVVDDYLANFWKQVFTDITVHSAWPLRSGGDLAVAIRKNTPQLAAELNGFIGRQGLNSTFGAVINRRYLQSTKYVKNATSDEERKKFSTLVTLFRRYGDKYKFDYLLMAAQGYQESRLDHGAKSAVGAIGVMQLMPETGKEQKVGDVRQLEPNIHAGVKYMRFIRDSFFEHEPMDDLNKGLFTFAAYNAGPGRVRQLRREAEQRGLNPNVWFGNVERIASERIGRETVTYVSNIYKYYVAYKLVSAERGRKKTAAGPSGLY